jgi:putative hydrolase of the HAD superfamily
MIKAIFFDLYGTLAGFKPSRYEIQSEACANFGITLTEQGVLKGYDQADSFMTEQNKTYPLRQMSEDERFDFFCEYEKRVIEGSGVDIDLKTAGQIWNTVRTIPYEMVIFDDVWPVLDELKSRNLSLGLLSNMNRLGSELLREFNLSNYMTFAITSLEVGVEKPNPIMFKKALEIAGVSGQEALHVGDQIGSDIDGAEASAVRPILIDRDGNHSDFSRCPKISGMAQLSDVLDSLS